MDRHEIIAEGLHYAGTLAGQKALTAPKGLGRDSVEVKLIEDKETLGAILEKAGSYGERWPFFTRDVQTLKDKKFALLLLYAENKPTGLNCGLCKKDCNAANSGEVFCVFSALDLGIALGVSVDLLRELGVDNRIQWTLGEACKDVGLCPKDSVAIGIPMHVSSKSIFFDRFWWNTKR
ncbi:ferredoxin [Coprothermobacteraceae bacterium]|nr:ferredoxin [Coprothermobacteraceae bacterium]